MFCGRPEEFASSIKTGVMQGASRPREFSNLLRIREWAADAREELRREWKSGDRIELELPLAM